MPGLSPGPKQAQRGLFGAAALQVPSSYLWPDPGTAPDLSLSGVGSRGLI